MIALGFVLGGLTKGVFGLGLPLIGVPVMATAIPFQTAVAVFAVSTFTSNLQQSLAGGRLREHFRRFWSLALCLALTTLLSARMLATIPQETGLLILGTMSIVFALMQLFPMTLTVRPQDEKWLSPVVGIIAGTTAGLAGISGPPLIVYLMALRLRKEDFVAAISLMYLLGSITLYGTLAAVNVLTLPVLIASTIGAVIVWAMLVIGRHVRDRIDEARYRKLILVLLMGLGLDMIRRGLT